MDIPYLVEIQTVYVIKYEFLKMYMTKPKILMDFWRIVQIYKQLDDLEETSVSEVN